MMLDEASIVVAILDGPDVDSGTAIEIGYAFAKGFICIWLFFLLLFRIL